MSGVLVSSDIDSEICFHLSQVLLRGHDLWKAGVPRRGIRHVDAEKGAKNSTIEHVSDSRTVLQGMGWQEVWTLTITIIFFIAFMSMNRIFSC